MIIILINNIDNDDEVDRTSRYSTEQEAAMQDNIIQ